MSRKEGRQILRATRPFTKEQRNLSWFHLWSGFGLMSLGMVASAAPMPWWGRTLASVFVGLCMLKLFIVYHDYMHGALLRDSKVAKVVMHGFGMFILAPPKVWKRSHDYHHANTAKMVGSQIGSYPTMSTAMYDRLRPVRQLAYRVARHPATIAFGWLTVFLIGMCIKPFLTKPKENAEAGLAVLGYLALGVVVSALFGFDVYFYAILLSHIFAAAIGGYLFYAQHNFPGVEIRSRHDWTAVDAALHASSYMKMGRIMQWFSGNIGYHHIHHLNPAIPFYRLPEAMEAVPELNKEAETTLGVGDIVDCLKLKLWDKDEHQMVGYPEPVEAAAGASGLPNAEHR
ncbi:MAG: fatty acid desaturase [Myxococcota bacterium]